MEQSAANGSLSISLLNREYSGNLANWILGFGLCTPMNPDVLVTYAGFACAVLAHCVTPVDWTRTRAGRMPAAMPLSYVVGLAPETDRRQARAQQHLPLARAPRVQIALVAGAPSQAAAALGGKPPGARLTCAIRSPSNVIRLTAVPETSASSSAWSLAARSCIAAAGAPVYIRRAPASIAAVNDARRHCQTHWIGPAEPIMNDFQAASCRHSASAAARAGLKMSRRLRWRWWLKWWWTET